MTFSRRPQLPDDHRLHDRLLVARAVGDDLDALDRAAADALFQSCPDCRTLAAELRAVRFTASTLTPPRLPRDFRLSPAQAERLRGGAVQRLFAPLGGPMFGFLQPLAGAVVAIGLGLLVVTSLPQAGSGGAASEFAAPAGGRAGASPGGSAAAGVSREPASAGDVQESPGFSRLNPVPSPSEPNTVPDKATGQPGLSPFGGPGAASDQGLQGQPRERLSEPAATDWRMVGLVLALLGFALLIARGYARRQAEDPLLR